MALPSAKIASTVPRENTKFDEPCNEYSLGGQMGIVESRPRAHGLDRRGLRGKDEVIKLALEGRKAPGSREGGE